jgi:hypothetical protein
MKDVVAAIRIECLVKTVLLSKVATCVLGVPAKERHEARRSDTKQQQGSEVLSATAAERRKIAVT